MGKFTKRYYQELLEKQFSGTGETVKYVGRHKGDFVFGIVPPKDEYGDFPCVGPPYYYICSPDEDHLRTYCGFDLEIDSRKKRTSKARSEAETQTS